MIISPFTPLRFDDGTQSDGLPSRFVQVFAQTDQIMIQVIAESGESSPTATLDNAHTGEAIGELTWQSWTMSSGSVLYFITLQGLSVGHYTITIGGNTCDEFRVTDDEQLLARTTLIQYRFKDNKQRDDVVSVIDYMPYFFDFRVPGGFKDSGWAFGVDNEQFTTQRQELIELYSMDYVTKTFTLGGPVGVPVWYGELLNRLLTCPYVYFDAVRYVRNDSEVPAMQTLVDGLDSFVFTQVLRKAIVFDPTMEEQNQLSIRRVIGTSDNVDFDTNRTTLNNSDEEGNYVLIN